MTENLAYASDEIVRYFSTNRVTWPQFYESERVIIDRLGLTPGQIILDIGCGCGGLGLVLRDRFGVQDYTGVEINSQAASVAKTMNERARILCGDILALGLTQLHGKRFDVVFSLSCVDWNVRFKDMLHAAWEFVRPGGQLVATFRLTDRPGCDNIKYSYQHINFSGAREGEIASYVVLNAGELVGSLKDFGPAAIDAFGYWGLPSPSAVTPYERLCFCALSVRKKLSGGEDIRLSLNLPAEILQSIHSSAR